MTKGFKRSSNRQVPLQKIRLTIGLWAIFLLIHVLTPLPINAQLVSEPILRHDIILQQSLDSLIATIGALRQEREELKSEVQQLNNRIRSMERRVDSRVNQIVSGQGTMMEGIDTLRVLMPSEEPIIATNTNVIYLNQRHDSLVAHVERLEDRILSLPDKHYWGVRNGFKQFDHLLLFTFLGALTSLGVVLLVRSTPESTEFSGDEVASQEEEADRLSISITLLVGSVLVVLFILFIL